MYDAHFFAREACACNCDDVDQDDEAEVESEKLTEHDDGDDRDVDDAKNDEDEAIDEDGDDTSDDDETNWFVLTVTVLQLCNQSTSAERQTEKMSMCQSSLCCCPDCPLHTQ